MKRCPATHCPQLIPRTTRYCTTHTRAYEQARGTSSQRGYDAGHRRTRDQEATRVATLTVHCHRCGLLILPTEPWDLGHSDDRKTYLGPEHAGCNRSHGGALGARIRNERQSF